MLRSYIGLKIQGAKQEAIYGPELHFSRILHWLQPVETQLFLEKTYISHVVLEQQKRITTQRFISAWEKAAATDFPPLTSRIFEISSDPFGFNAKICPWKIIPITLSQNLLCDVPISLVIFGFNIMRDDVKKSDSYLIWSYKQYFIVRGQHHCWDRLTYLPCFDHVYLSSFDLQTVHRTSLENIDFSALAKMSNDKSTEVQVRMFTIPTAILSFFQSVNPWKLPCLSSGLVSAAA